MRNPPDKLFLTTVFLLSIAGFIIFISASLGWFGREGVNFFAVAVKQFSVLVLGLISMMFISKINYKRWRAGALYLLIASIVATLLVFVPGLGIEAGGAKRWISLFGFSLQPSEFLKLAIVIYVAAWMSSFKNKITTFTYGLLPLGAVLGIAGIILLLQPDTDTFLVLAVSAVAIFWTAGGRWSHLGVMVLIGVIGLSGLVLTRPYLKDRITTFIDPSLDTTGASYQINQSLIAIGSGKIFGRGFGQSVQKFNYLPEPTSDSVFAVASEEFGFLGGAILIILFTIFGVSGLKIAGRAPDSFSRLLVTGLVILVIAQSFVNIASMLGIIPLAGIPLLFVSQGGSALLFVLIEAGIILNISRYQIAK